MALIICDTHSLIRQPHFLVPWFVSRGKHWIFGGRSVEHQAGKGQAPAAHQIQMFIVLNEKKWILRFTTCQSAAFGGAFLRLNLLKCGLHSIKLDHMCSSLIFFLRIMLANVGSLFPSLAVDRILVDLLKGCLHWSTPFINFIELPLSKRLYKINQVGYPTVTDQFRKVVKIWMLSRCFAQKRGGI